MSSVRNFIEKSIEKSAESFPSGGHIRSRRDLTHEKIVHWRAGRGYLEVSFTKRTGTTESNRKLDVTMDSESKKVQNLRYESASRSFEGSLDDLGLLKIGRAAVVLYDAAGLSRA